MPRNAWMPPPMAKADVLAIKAMATGTANDGQQKRALEWILREVTRVEDLISFEPGGLEGDRATAFAEGKRYVGSWIEKVRDMKANEVEKLP